MEDLKDRRTQSGPTPRLSFSWERDYPGLTDIQLYGLAADVERYPDFIPGCIATRVVVRGQCRWHVDNLFGFGPMRVRFRSVATLDAPRTIRIASNSGPWERFRLTWQFAARDGGCHVTCTCECQLRSPLLTRMALVALPGVEALIIRAFERRLRGLPRTVSSLTGAN